MKHAVALLLLLGSLVHSAAAGDIFMKIEGIPGESKDKVHVNEIEVLSYSWGASNPATTRLIGGGGAGKVSVQDLSFTKYVDKSSPQLLLAVATGKHIARAVLIFRRSNGVEVELYRLSNLLVTSVTTASDAFGEYPLAKQNVTLSFAQFEYAYRQDVPGGSKDPPQCICYSMQRNGPCVCGPLPASFTAPPPVRT